MYNIIPLIIAGLVVAVAKPLTSKLLKTDFYQDNPEVVAIIALSMVVLMITGFVIAYVINKKGIPAAVVGVKAREYFFSAIIFIAQIHLLGGYVVYCTIAWDKGSFLMFMTSVFIPFSVPMGIWSFYMGLPMWMETLFS